MDMRPLDFSHCELRGSGVTFRARTLSHKRQGRARSLGIKAVSGATRCPHQLVKEHGAEASGREDESALHGLDQILRLKGSRER